jgi:hypothetical protein
MLYIILLGISPQQATDYTRVLYGTRRLRSSQKWTNQCCSYLYLITYSYYEIPYVVMLHGAVAHHIAIV